MRISRPLRALRPTGFRWTVLTLILLFGGVIAVYVWPTRYSYAILQGRPVRTDRFTDEVSVLDMYGWIRIRPPAAPKEPPAPPGGPAPGQSMGDYFRDMARRENTTAPR